MTRKSVIAAAAGSFAQQAARTDRTPHFLKPWGPDYFRKRFGDATAVVFALPMADGRMPSGKAVVFDTHRSMPVALAAIRKTYPTAAAVHTRGQFWATLH